jgi:hypothetical protein
MRLLTIPATKAAANADPRAAEHARYQQLHEFLMAELQPQGILERLTFDNLVRAAWNMQALRSHHAVARSERAYYRAIDELRKLQTNRALRELELEAEEEDQVPDKASIYDLTKRSQNNDCQRLHLVPRPAGRLTPPATPSEKSSRSST